MYPAETRASFVKAVNSGNFQCIKHIIVDEAQNFRLEHGPWYKRAKEIVQRSAYGILWIFLDYFQMSHPYDTGLPRSAEQYPQVWLTTAVRNATCIYNIMKHEMERIVDNEKLCIPHQVLRKLLDESKCGHITSGACKRKENLSWQEIARYVAEECHHYLEKGYSKKDIAILCSTRDTCNSFKDLLTKEMLKLRLDRHFVEANEVMEDKIVLDSIRRFSGLERLIVFGINPTSVQNEVLHNLLLCLVSRANLHIHVLYERATTVQTGAAQ